MGEEREAYVGAWGASAHGLRWRVPFDGVWEDGPHGGTWFPGGELSVYENCLGRHLPERASQVALHWEGEPGDRRTLTYGELADQVDRLAHGLTDLGVARGDRVALHLGWVPETVVALLACARIGATYTILPISLPVEAISLRLAEFAPKVLMTQDGAWRRSAILPLKARVDEALSAYDGVSDTIVLRRTGIDVSWFEGDHWYSDIVACPPTTAESASTGIEDPLFSISLAARGGRPVSLVHHGPATMAVARRVHRDGIAAGEVLWALGDASWLASQVHGIFGPLLWGETAVMYEGTIDVPSPHRLWDIVRRFGVTTLLMPPSVGLALRGLGKAVPAEDAIRTLRRIVTIGDDPGDELSGWLAEEVGRGRVEVADGWGQMELCGVVLVDHPPDGRRMPDVGTLLLDVTSRGVSDQGVGELALRRSWPGLSATIAGEHADLVTRSHWSNDEGVYATGDLARVDVGGALSFVGRIDEVASVSGQLVSLEEIRETLVEHPFVATAEVVSYREPRHGSSVAAAVVLDPQSPPLGPEAVREQLSTLVEDVLGGIARPRTVIILDEIGQELTRLERRRGLEVLAATSVAPVVRLGWSQVVGAVRGVR